MAIDPTAPPYNAVGDGVTDDRAALQSAINAARALGPRSVVLVPDGKTFFISTALGPALTVGDDIILDGPGTILLGGVAASGGEVSVFDVEIGHSATFRKLTIIGQDNPNRDLNIQKGIMHRGGGGDLTVESVTIRNV